MTDIRLVAYAPNGARLGPLPTPEDASLSIPLNDLGAVSLKYPPVGARTDLLGQPLEVVAEVSHDQGVTWAEPPDGRFLYLRDGRDPLRDDSYSVECPAYVTRLEKALVGTTGLDDEGKRSFTDASPGAILVPLLQEAQARGALTGMSWAFTATHDSSGAPWAAEAAQSVGYDVGTSLLAILLGLAEAALVDFRTNGRALEVFNPESATGMGADRTLGANPVTLRPGRDLTEAPFRRTWEGLADTALVQGDAGTFLERTNGAALAPWGRQETFITASGVTDTGTLTVLADAHLSLTAEERAEFTVGLDFSRAVHLPLRDYAPGEWVYRVTELGALERVRVRQVTLTLDNQGRSGGNAVLNDRFLEQDVKTARRIAAVTGGATAATPGQPSGVGNDILAPAKPLGLDHSTAAYIDRRVPQAQVTLSWLAVTTNADGTPISDLDHYEVWRRNTLEGPTAWEMVATVQADRTSWSDSPYEPGTLWEFRVRAVDSVFNWSAFSDPEPVTMAQDIQAPPKPSAPVLATRNGILEATWDGEDATGVAMPGDVERVELHRHQDPAHIPTAGDSTTLVGSYYGPGLLVVSSTLTGGDSWSARLVAVDYAGNAGPASDPDSAVVDPIQVGDEPDAPATSPAAEVIALGIGALMVRFPAVAGAEDYAVYLDDAPIPNAPLDPAKLLTLTGGGTATAAQRLPRTAAPLVPGTTYYARILARNVTGDAVAGLGAEGSGTPRQATGPDISSSYVYGGVVEAAQLLTGDLEADLAILGQLMAGNAGGARVELDPAGLRQYDSSGQLLVDLPTAPGGVNTLQAELVTQALTALGRAQFRGRDNEVSRDSELTLASGVTDPANSPQVVDYLATAKVQPGGAEVSVPPGSNGLYGYYFQMNPDYDTPSLAWDSTRSRFTWVKAKTLSNVTRQYLYTWSPSTGALTETLIQGTASPRIPAAQIPAGYTDPDTITSTEKPAGETKPLDERATFQGGAVVGDYLYLLVGRGLVVTSTVGNIFPAYGGFFYVYRVNVTTGAMDGNWCWRWTDPVTTAYYNPTGGFFGAGDWVGRNVPNLAKAADGNLWLAQVHPDTGLPKFWKKNATTGANVTTFSANVAAPNPTDRVAAIVEGAFTEGSRLAVKLGASSTVHHLNPATGATYGSAEQWEGKGGVNSDLGYDGTRFYSMSGDFGSVVYVHTTSLDVTPTHWAYTWYDPDPGGTGTHETSISPVATLTPKKRWGVQTNVTVAPPVVAGDPDSPSQWRMYASTGATPPGPSSMKLQGTQSGTYGYYVYTDPATGRPTTTGSAAPTDNTFPNGYSGEIRSGTGGFLLRGDGTGTWPYLEDALEAYADMKAAQAEANAKASVFAPGDILTSAATARSGGWLLCNGTFVNQSAYSALFGAIGHRHNNNVDPGDGTFRLPDFRDRQAVGSSGTKALGSTGGAESQVIGAANLPPHAHTIAHTHDITHDHANATVAMRSAAGGSSAPVRGNSTADGSASVNIPQFAGNSGAASTGNSGNGPGTSTPLATQDPYVAVNVFIKT